MRPRTRSDWSEVVPPEAVAPLQGAMVVVASQLDAMWSGGGGCCCDGGDCLRHPFMTELDRSFLSIWKKERNLPQILILM